MLISTIIILFTIIAYNIRHRLDKITYVFSLYFISISLLLVVSALYASKFSNYVYTIQIDYKIYLILSDIRLHINEIVRLYNVGVVLFLSASLICMGVLNNYKLNRKMFLLILPIIYFYIVNDPHVWEIIYIKINLSDPNKPNYWSMIINAIKVLNTAIVWLYMILPVITMLRILVYSILRIRKRHIILLLVCIVLIDVFVYFIILEGIWKNINYNNRGILGFPMNNGIQNGYIIIPLLSLYLFVTIMLILIKFKPYQRHINSNHQYLSNTIKCLSNNLGVVLHDYKNAFIVSKRMTIIAMDDIESESIDECKQELKLLNHMLSQKIDTVNEMIKITKPINLKKELIDINACIDEALNNSAVPRNIIIEKNILCNTEFEGDFSHLSEVFLNIINNAVAAIENGNSEEKRIDILVFEEDEYLIIDIKDTGLGIEKKNISKIFNAFWSSNMSLHNSGVGLTYARNIVIRHSGDIEVKSTVGKGTLMRIVLPRYTRIKMPEYM